jgi:hypothetical protein
MGRSASEGLSVVDFVLFSVFLTFYAGLFYHLPVLVAGVHDLRRESKGTYKLILDNQEKIERIAKFQEL